MIPMKLWFTYLFKYNKEEKKQCKAYFKMMRAYKKKLVKFAKGFEPWEMTAELLDGLNIMINWTKDYFEQDYNVEQDKESKTNQFDKIIGSLRECCRNLNLIIEDKWYEPYFKLLKELRGKSELVETEVSKGVACAGAKSITVKYEHEETPEIRKALKLKEKECTKAKEKVELDLFVTIAKNYERWCY